GKDQGDRALLRVGELLRPARGPGHPDHGVALVSSSRACWVRRWASASSPEARCARAAVCNMLGERGERARAALTARWAASGCRWSRRASARVTKLSLFGRSSALAWSKARPRAGAAPSP